MDWGAAEAKLETVAASVFDKDELLILPRKEGISVNQPRVEDGSRPAFTALGTFETGVPALAASGHFAGDPSSKALPVNFEAVVTAHVACWPHIPGRGDRMTVGGKSYDIMNVDRDGTQRAVFYLNSSR